MIRSSNHPMAESKGVRMSKFVVPVSGMHLHIIVCTINCNLLLWLELKPYPPIMVKKIRNRVDTRDRSSQPKASTLWTLPRPVDDNPPRSNNQPSSNALTLISCANNKLARSQIRFVPHVLTE